MHAPALYNDFLVLVYNGFNECQLLFLESVVVYQFYWRYVVLSFISIFKNVNMDRLMVVGIEHEPKSEKDEYCRHNIYNLALWIGEHI